VSGLDAHVGVRFPEFAVDVRLSVQPGEVVALLGPNGAGKTTVLRALAGLQPLDHGSLVLDGIVIDDPSVGGFVETSQRSVGVVFQDYLLFPHLSVRENVAFGLRARGTAKAPARATADEWLGRMGLAELAARRPAELSGGQQQRVALARALAYGPRLLLLDEPLAALDAATRRDVRRELQQHLDAFQGCTVLVTHDPVDAYALADRVVVLEQGGVMQQGTLAEVAAHPRSRYVAELVGINLLSGAVAGGVFEAEGGGRVVVGDDAADGVAFLAIRPQSVSLHLGRPEGSQRNVWQATVAAVDSHHDRVRVQLSGAVPIVAEITPAALASLGLQQGMDVWAAVKASEVVTYPR
jgi:molybdate transport system ATP-binding protein